LAAGFFGGHAGGREKRDFLLEVIAQLFVEFGVGTAATEEGAEAKRNGVEPVFRAHVQPPTFIDQGESKVEKWKT
jgi:hypothetical protein